MSNGWGSSAGLNPDAQVFDKLGGMPSLIKPNGVGNDKVASNGDHKNGDSGHDNEKHENGSHEKENVKDTSGWAQAQPYDYSSDNHTWDGNARIYEYDGEDGEFGPEFPELEDQLFGPATSRSGHGIDFSKITEIAVTQEGPIHIEPLSSFSDARIHPIMKRNIELAGYKVPTPIQKFCIPAIAEGNDVIAIAQTGSGKTAAYMIPIINGLMTKAKKLTARETKSDPYGFGFSKEICAEPLAVIVCPSRELAVQIFNEARKFSYRTMLRPAVIYGGGPIREQIAQLSKGCDILIASPGRLVDFIDRPHILSLRRLRYMVIDEADEMLDADWEEEFNKILGGGGQEEGSVKYMLFSATFPKSARDLAKSHLSEGHVRLRVGRAGSSHENITQEIIYVEPHLKQRALFDLLTDLGPHRSIIFVNSKRTADELDDFIFNRGIPCTSMHSDRTQKEREAAMRAFRSGHNPVMISTGVSARGIDVRSVNYVINYDLPSIDHGGIEEYTHRIGRTGRIGYHGKAISFYSEKDESLASVLTRTLLETKQEIPDFLQEYVPEGEDRENLKFETDSNFDDGTGGDGGDGDAGGGAWGGDTAGAWGGGGDNQDGGGDAWGGGGDAWGAGAPAGAEPEPAAW